MQQPFEFTTERQKLWQNFIELKFVIKKVTDDKTQPQDTTDPSMFYH